MSETGEIVVINLGYKMCTTKYHQTKSTDTYKKGKFISGNAGIWRNTQEELKVWLVWLKLESYYYFVFVGVKLIAMWTIMSFI